MIDYSLLLFLLKKGWEHPTYEWKKVINTWPKVPHNLIFKSTQKTATQVEYPWQSGISLLVSEIIPEVELFDKETYKFIKPEGILRSDLDVKELDKSSFACMISQILGLGKSKPIEVSQGLFKLPVDGYNIFLGLENTPSKCISQIRFIEGNHGNNCTLISITPHFDNSAIKEAAKNLLLLNLDDVIQINSTGIPQGCDLIELIGNMGRTIRQGTLNLEISKLTKWKNIRIVITTECIEIIKNQNLINDSVRFYVVSNNVVISQTAPICVRDLHNRFHDGHSVTALWLMLRDYAKGNGIRSQRETKKNQDVDNTNRSELGKVLKELIGLSEAPFNPTRPSTSKFKIYFKTL